MLTQSNHYFTKKEIQINSPWAPAEQYSKAICVSEYSDCCSRANGLTTNLKLSALFLCQFYRVAIKAMNPNYAREIVEDCKQGITLLEIKSKGIEVASVLMHSSKRHYNDIPTLILQDHSIRYSQ